MLLTALVLCRLALTLGLPIDSPRTSLLSPRSCDAVPQDAIPDFMNMKLSVAPENFKENLKKMSMGREQLETFCMDEEAKPDSKANIKITDERLHKRIVRRILEFLRRLARIFHLPGGDRNRDVVEAIDQGVREGTARALIQAFHEAVNAEEKIANWLVTKQGEPDHLAKAMEQWKSWMIIASKHAIRARSNRYGKIDFRNDQQYNSAKSNISKALGGNKNR